MNGCDNYSYNFAVAIIDGVIGRIGFAVLLGIVCGLGYMGYWLGNAIGGLMPFLIGMVYYLSGRWKKRPAFCAPVNPNKDKTPALFVRREFLRFD